MFPFPKTEVPAFNAKAAMKVVQFAKKDLPAIVAGFTNQKLKEEAIRFIPTLPEVYDAIRRLEAGGSDKADNDLIHDAFHKIVGYRQVGFDFDTAQQALLAPPSKPDLNAPLIAQLKAKRTLLLEADAKLRKELRIEEAAQVLEHFCGSAIMGSGIDALFDLFMTDMPKHRGMGDFAFPDLGKRRTQ